MDQDSTLSAKNRWRSGTAQQPAVVFGNALSPSHTKKAARWQQRIIRRFSYDPSDVYSLGVEKNAQLGPLFGVKNVVRAEQTEQIDPDNAVLCATARAGYGPHRAAMAVASCAHAMGYQPYWLDLLAIPGIPEDVMEWVWDTEYSRFSRLSERSKLFDRFVWEHVTSGQPTLPGVSHTINAWTRIWPWKYLKSNVRDTSISRLFTNLYTAMPRDLPVITTHPWNAQAAVAADMTKVLNLVLDNWPVAFWLAEGAQHLVQSPSAYYGYRTMTGFTEDSRILQPMPAEAIHQVGHFIDHELVSNAENDCAARLDRAAAGEPRRFLMSMGGAGAQRDVFEAIVEHLVPHVESNQAALYINVGDHQQHLDWLVERLGALRTSVQTHLTWESTVELVEAISTGTATGIHIFLYDNILNAVYATNYLMRVTDVLITKPSELAFYPIPKILTQRVGGHEAGGAIRCAELGDGTPETRTIAQTLNAIDLMMTEEDLLQLFCQSIVTNKGTGIYDGAYKAIAMAMSHTGE